MLRNSMEPAIPADILDRVLAKLGVSSKPTLDLAGLSRVYAAFSGHVPNDNIQKRIWLAGDRARPLTGGDPVEFFVNWLEHGTGGTCFPANGALCALLGRRRVWTLQTCCKCYPPGRGPHSLMDVLITWRRLGRARRRAGVRCCNRNTLGEAARLASWLMPMSGQQWFMSYTDYGRKI
jgi:hypothetical protein